MDPGLLLKEDLHFPAEIIFHKFLFLLFSQLDQHMTSGCLYLFRYLSFHAVSPGALPSGIFEDMGLVKARALYHVSGLFKFFL